MKQSSRDQPTGKIIALSIATDNGRPARLPPPVQKRSTQLPEPSIHRHFPPGPPEGLASKLANAFWAIAAARPRRRSCGKLTLTGVDSLGPATWFLSNSCAKDEEQRKQRTGPSFGPRGEILLLCAHIRLIPSWRLWSRAVISRSLPSGLLRPSPGNSGSGRPFSPPLSSLCQAPRHGRTGSLPFALVVVPPVDFPVRAAGLVALGQWLHAPPDDHPQ